MRRPAPPVDAETAALAEAAPFEKFGITPVEVHSPRWALIDRATGDSVYLDGAKVDEAEPDPARLGFLQSYRKGWVDHPEKYKQFRGIRYVDLTEEERDMAEPGCGPVALAIGLWTRAWFKRHTLPADAQAEHYRFEAEEHELDAEIATEDGDMDRAAEHRAEAADYAALAREWATPPKAHPLANYVPLNLGRVEAPEFVLDNLIQAGVVVLSGGQGQGKTVQLVSLMVKVAHLCKPDDPLRPRLRRRVIYISEDVQQVRRTLAALQRFGGSGCSAEDFEEWFKVVPATRGEADRFIEVKPEYLKLRTANQRKDGTVFMADPVVVVDTKSSVFNIMDENDNAIGSAIVAELKQQFTLPLIIIGHLAKALSRTDVATMSMRGAGSWEADVHQTVYLYADEAIGRDLRFMHFALPAKRRFEGGIDVLEFTGRVNHVQGVNVLGETVLVSVRHAECREVTLDEVSEVKADAREARAEERKAKLIEKWAARVEVAMREMDRSVSKQEVADHLGSTKETIAPALARLQSTGAVVSDGSRTGAPLWRLKGAADGL